MYLIVNADDFGLTASCVEGTLQAMKEGIVSSTTVMMNMPAALKGIEKAKQQNVKKMGVHLTLTCGRPLLPTEQVPSLVDENGNFRRRVPLMLEYAKQDEVEKEWRAQIELFLQTGMQLTHFDSHHHSHCFGDNPQVAFRLAKEYNVPLRHMEHEETNIKQMMLREGIKTTDYFAYDFFAENVNAEFLKASLLRYLEKEKNEGRELVVEYMSHPAFCDDEIRSISSYTEDREKEMKLLSSQEIKDFLRAHSIKLTDFTVL